MRTLLFVSLLIMMCSCGSKERAGDPLDEAKRLAEKGMFKQALEKHIWLHDHVLEDRPSYRGVRLSFALSEWIELGKKYPKALEALKAIRDKKTGRLVAGERSRELFHDVASINHYLGDSKATVELFKKIGAVQPEFTASIYDLADGELVEAQEYGLAKKYLADPMSRFSTARQQFDRGMQYAKTSPMGHESRRAFERIFTTKVLRLITVLDKTGDRETARRIQTEALKVLESPLIRHAMTN